VMAQTGCQRPCNPAINEKKRKQNDSGAFHGSKYFLPSAPPHYKRRSENLSPWTAEEPADARVKYQKTPQDSKFHRTSQHGAALVL
jgi:hypothetical protein